MVTKVWSRIENGLVAEVTDIDPDGRFHSSLHWVACPENVKPGWMAESSNGEVVFSEPKGSASDYIALIASRRYAAEGAGITINGMFIDTARDSQSLITGAALAALRDAAYSCRWKTPSGFITLDAPTLLSLAGSVRAHVQACFDREDELLMEVADGDFTISMLEEGWPS
jgi:hypothetical protein